MSLGKLLTLSTRNRALVFLALMALAPVVLEIIELPNRRSTYNIFGSELSIVISTDLLLLVLLPALACAGADWVIRDHPDVRDGEVPFLFPFWVAPGFAAFALATALTQIMLWELWIIVLFTGVFAIGLLLMAEYVSLSPNSRGYIFARLLLTSCVYGIAFILFTFIYGARERSLISATLTLLVAFGLSLDLLSPHIIGLRSAMIQGVVISLMVGQATWAINYWNISNLAAGVILLTIFYVLAGLAQQYFQDRLTRTVLAEFAGVSIMALVIAWQLANVR
jgi:hypothetical protein